MFNSVENVELIIEGGNCRLAAHTLLSVLAYPASADEEKRSRFVAAGSIEHLRWIRRMLPRKFRSEMNSAFAAIEDMPVQQAENVLNRGLGRVGHRLAAAYMFRQLLLLQDAAPHDIRRVTWDRQDINTARVHFEGMFDVSSQLEVIRQLAPSLRRLIPVGGIDQKAFKNIQDRVLRPSVPLIHLANPLLGFLQTADRTSSPGSPPLHWSSRVLMQPAWVRQVVRDGMAAKFAHWLTCREVNLHFPFEAMIDVELVERSVTASSGPTNGPSLRF